MQLHQQPFSPYLYIFFFLSLYLFHKKSKSKRQFIMAQFKLPQPSKRELNGGDLLAQSLKRLGTEVAFGLHGGHLDAFLLGAHESGIKLIDTRHEQVAVQAAEGYAKISGKVGVCFVTANSGYGIA
jgi:hypothetical protein